VTISKRRVAFFGFIWGLLFGVSVLPQEVRR
jgi:hypothetical protein